jgi:hypothetical protein
VRADTNRAEIASVCGQHSVYFATLGEGSNRTVEEVAGSIPVTASFLILPLKNKKNAVNCGKSATGVDPAERSREARKMRDDLADAAMPDLPLTRALKPS